ncbi:MAG TPA: hypothetical protein VMH26_07015 [Burkholderiales bacterium]|nr:hypothetical protein [Burkholderiales bacterium]
MQRWRSVLSVLMILWLPLQGLAAHTMPFCKHGHRTPPARVTGPANVHPAAQQVHRDVVSNPHSQPHPAARAGTHRHGGPSGDLACDDCDVCELACSPAAPASPNAVEPAGAQAFTRFSPTLPPLFVPEQRNRPPLAAIG